MPRTTTHLAALSALAGLALAPACDDGGDGSGGGTLTSSSTVSGVGGATGVTTTTAVTSTGTGPYDISCDEAHTDVDETACSLLTQDCGEYATCAVAGTAATCSSALGLKGVGLSCEVDGECKAGLVCLLGTCVNHCCPSNNEPCGNGLCQRVNLGAGFAHFCTYFTVCDIFDPGSCEADEGCYIDPGSELNICVGYASLPPAGDGEACTALNDCASGMECRGGTCEWLCDRNLWESLEPGTGGCPGGQSCNPSFGLANPIGTCT